MVDKPRVTHVIKEVLRVKRESKLLTTFWIILDYIVYFRNNGVVGEYPGVYMGWDSKGDKEEDKENIKVGDDSNTIVDEGLFMFSKTDEGTKVIDAIQAIALYLLLTFDWEFCQDAIKDYQSEKLYCPSKDIGEEKHLSTKAKDLPSQYGYDLFSFILRTSHKFVNGSPSIRLPHQQYIGKLIVNYFFNGSEGRNAIFIGPSTALALLAVALNQPLSWFDHYHEDCLIKISTGSNMSRDKKRLSSNQRLLEAILVHMPYNFTEEAIKCAISHLAVSLQNNPRLSKELMESKRLTGLVFDLSVHTQEPELTALQRIVLKLLLVDHKEKAVWDLLKIHYHPLVLLDDIAGYFLQNFAQIGEKQTGVNFLKVLQLLEDFVNFDQGQAKDPEFIKILGKVILALDKLDLLYASVPPLVVFDKRVCDAINVATTDSTFCREGGVLRILLKLIFYAIKAEPSTTADTCALLKYVVFREKLAKKSIKALSALGELKPFKKIPKKKTIYNIIDTAFIKDPARIKLQLSRNEFFIKKVVGKKIPLLDTIKYVKPPKSKDENMFEQGSLLLAYILGQLFQLLHFELLRVNGYSDLPSSIEELKSYIEAIKDLETYSNKFKELVGIVIDIVKSAGKSEVLMTLVTDFVKLMSRLKEKRCAYFVPAKLRPDSPSPPESTSSESLPVSSIPNEELKEQKAPSIQLEAESGDISFGTQDSQFGQFLLLWDMFCEALVGNLNHSKDLAESCSILSNLLLTSNNLRIIQPYLLLCTNDVLVKYDKLLASKIPSPPVLPRPKVTAESREATAGLEERVRDKICYIGIHKEKIERDELRTDFNSLVGSFVKKLMKEQELETNPWNNKKRRKYEENLFKYVSHIYNDKVLKRCPLHQKLLEMGKIQRTTLKRFTGLMKSRDDLGRALKLKPLRDIEQDGLGAGHNFGYLVRFTLKKFLILRLANGTQRQGLISGGFMDPDFKFTLQRQLFTVPRITRKIPGAAQSEVSVSRSRSQSMSEVSLSEISSEQDLALITAPSKVQNGDYLPKSNFLHIK
eukprot:TRINITY_DN494_c0_g1_i2.p1 TRINITY_DN494_c0_g1~~TRINITY_DN494_c0_g1_i2.p1  ORF type:complete len:1036 (-),score=90.99 TRINITY_DN494_c0_g1_i2:3717-6824(-)